MEITIDSSKKKLTWLITGCSSGFGLSLARIAQAGGHTVIATSRNPNKTPELVEEIKSRGGKWLQLDVNSLTAGKAVIEELEASGIEVDVLINNAGYCVFGAVEALTEEETRMQLETMFFGPLRMIRAVLPGMRKRRFGVVVNMSSGASLDGAPSMGVYAGAKAGLDAVTKVLAKEVAPFNIRTLTTILGTFNTNMGGPTSISQAPPPDDYKGSMVEKICEMISTGAFPLSSDKDKGMKALYEVIVGEGVGAGHEAEKLLLLGGEMPARAKGVQDYLGHSIDVFGSIATSVGI